MIQAQELRIGNWVFANMGGEYIQVDLESFEMIADDFGGFEPIPLTPEILEKCGFDKLRRLYLKSKWYDYPENNKPKLTAINNNEFEISRSGLGSFHPECRYLHQLQNLYFALTGEELTIDL
jgi:hypothetical protein